MQRIYRCELTPEEYVESEGHRQVLSERVCPRCGRPGRLHRHGIYRRGITGGIGQIVMIWVARFLCLKCGRTVSYLPDFALSYRLVRVETFEAFLEGKRARRDVVKWEPLLEEYKRRMNAYRVALWRAIGYGLGGSPPGDEGPWPWLKEACGGLGSAACRLVNEFRTTLFKKYPCHQPAKY
jgi:transposase-like protein